MTDNLQSEFAAILAVARAQAYISAPKPTIEMRLDIRTEGPLKSEASSTVSCAFCGIDTDRRSWFYSFLPLSESEFIQGIPECDSCHEKAKIA